MKRALIFGRAKGVWGEVALAKAHLEFDYVFGVGSASTDYPEGLTGIVSFHSELFPRWAEVRAQRKYPTVGFYWTNFKPRIRQGTPLDWKGQVRTVECSGGSSGLIAVYVALKKYLCDEVVLAGIPLSPEAGQYDGPKPWKEGLIHRQIWEARVNDLRGKVTSLSGWTRDLLGAPTGIMNVAA